MKPSNCFVIDEGRRAGLREARRLRHQQGPHVRRRAGAPHLTRTNSALGTPLYMSPEQARSPRDVDHRTDLYSVGRHPLRAAHRANAVHGGVAASTPRSSSRSSRPSRSRCARFAPTCPRGSRRSCTGRCCATSTRASRPRSRWPRRSRRSPTSGAPRSSRGCARGRRSQTPGPLALADAARTRARSGEAERGDGAHVRERRAAARCGRRATDVGVSGRPAAPRRRDAARRNGSRRRRSLARRGGREHGIVALRRRRRPRARSPREPAAAARGRRLDPCSAPPAVSPAPSTAPWARARALGASARPPRRPPSPARPRQPRPPRATAATSRDGHHQRDVTPQAPLPTQLGDLKLH